MHFPLIGTPRVFGSRNTAHSCRRPVLDQPVKVDLKNPIAEDLHVSFLEISCHASSEIETTACYIAILVSQTHRTKTNKKWESFSNCEQNCSYLISFLRKHGITVELTEIPTDLNYASSYSHVIAEEFARLYGNIVKYDSETKQLFVY